MLSILGSPRPRAALALVLSFAAGSVAGAVGGSRYEARNTQRQAIDSPAVPSQERRAMDLYRAGELAVNTAPHADVRRAMDLYREGERSVEQAPTPSELRQAMDLYREGERNAR